MKQILVVGGTGVIGQAAISACRLVFGDKANIIATSTKCQQIAGADESIELKLTRENIQSHDWIKPLLSGRPFRLTFFTPAFASSVGKPACEVTQEERQEAFDYSVAPFLDLERWGDFGTLVGFSSIWQLPLIQYVYGGMVYAKSEMERWGSEKPEKRQIFRFGAVESKSLRGIAVMIARRWRNKLAELNQIFPHVRDFQHRPLSQALLEEVLAQEREFCGSSQPTTKCGITAYIVDWLRTRRYGIRNLVGDVSWVGRHQRPLKLIPVIEWDPELVRKFVDLHRNFGILPG